MTRHVERTNSPLAAESATGSRSPMTLRARIARVWLRFVHGMNLGILSVYMGAGALVGIEGLVLVTSFTTMWPMIIPFVISALAFVYFMRERLRNLWHHFRGL